MPSKRPRKRAKPVKPVLPAIYQKRLAEEDYFLAVKLTIKADCGDRTARRVAQRIDGTIEVEFVEPGTEESSFVEIGYIWGWRTVSFYPGEVFEWADSINQDTYTAFEWLLYNQEEFDPEEVLIRPVLYLDLVTIEPAWRGHGLTLLAVATYLDLVACEFVFLIPSPPNPSNLSPCEHKYGQRILRQYWQKLGFKNYDAKSNVLWTEEWSCPHWLRGKF